jgi:hypothetical protein
MLYRDVGLDLIGVLIRRRFPRVWGVADLARCRPLAKVSAISVASLLTSSFLAVINRVSVRDGRCEKCALSGFGSKARGTPQVAGLPNDGEA